MKTLRRYRSHIDSNKIRFKLDRRPSTYSTALEENAILRDYLEKTVKLSPEEIQGLLQHGREILLPLSIFNNQLSTLEVVVKYLHEIERLPFSQIAVLLNRDQRTIWHAYRRAIKKKIILKIQPSEMAIPVSIFSTRKYAPLEALAAYLKDTVALTFSNIARHLQLSPKTVWTEYHRYQKKQQGR